MPHCCGILVFLKTMRSLSREVVFKYLFSTFFNEDSKDELFNRLLKEEKLSEQDVGFATDLRVAIDTHREELLSTLNDYSTDYKIERIFTADKCAIILGMAEMKYIEGIPASVSIDEAVKIAKKYSAERSVDFVNGILGAFSRGN